MNNKKKLVVIGGGYAGVEVAKSMDAHADVTLVEQREAFVLPPSAIRALVQPGLLDQIILPHDKLLSHGRVVRGRAEQVLADAVLLADGTKIDADYIVIATGSSYAAPFKPAGESIEDFVTIHSKISAQLAQAKSVTIVGAGAVGTELAGEIKAVRPDMKVNLISSDSTLFPMYPPRLGAQLKQKLEGMGVSVVLGQRAKNLQHMDRPYEGSISLTDGRVITSDLIFPVIGSRPQTTLVETIPDITLAASGRVKTDAWMRAGSCKNVFVAGDVADVGDGMTIVGIMRQAPWLIKTLKAAIGGTAIEDQRPYKPWRKAPIIIPLGAHVGNSWVFATVGDWLTRQLKGKNLFIPKYRKVFGLPTNKELPTDSAQRKRPLTGNL